MRAFYQRAVERLDRLDQVQLRDLFRRLTIDNDLLGTALDSMGRVIIVTDTQGRILLVNKAGERLVPFNTPDYTQNLVWKVVSDPQISSFLEKTLRLQENAHDCDFTTTIGATRTLSFGVLPLVHDGHVAGNLIYAEDVTEKRIDEVRFRRAEGLAALTTLTAGVAHEIKNPLGAIGIHLQLVQRSLQTENLTLSETARKGISDGLNVIEEEVERLNQIVVNYLFAVRPMDLDLISGEVNDVLIVLLRLLRPELDEAEIQLKEELSDSLPRVLLDQRHLREALMNIVKNSITAMTGPRMAGQSRILTVGSFTDGEAVTIRISDSGPGIPQEIQQKIFEPYFSTSEFSSGLGLMLVYKIVKEHLGDIELDSKIGIGTTFSIRIPIPQDEKRLLGFKVSSV